MVNEADQNFMMISALVAYLLAPFFGWLADVQYGRYKIINFASFVAFLSSTFFFLALTTEVNELLSPATIVIFFGESCYKAAMLPFLTDQIIGATSDELSTIVRWYYWATNFGFALSDIVVYFDVIPFVGLAGIFAVPLAVIIISDCLCQQWLDRTHKVTNPIKLIIQVLNYTRKHRYPERRSAFTYIDEEQPTRMDYGKEKFGGPFTEEEVEDVKTVLRLLPIVTCLYLSVSALKFTPISVNKVNTINDALLSKGLDDWLIPLLLIPFYQLIVRPCFCSIPLSMLRCIGISLFAYVLGYTLLVASELYGVITFIDTQRYISCSALKASATRPDNFVRWYWKLVPFLLYEVGYTFTFVLLYEFVIAQSPDKMKGLVFGLFLAFGGSIGCAMSYMTINLEFTLCFDVPFSGSLVVLFLVFLVLSKRYTT